MRLQGNSKTGTYGAAWKSLVCIDIIKKYLKRAKNEYARSRNSGFLVIAINTALNLAQKYFKLISETPMYSAALLLNPTQKWDYFESKRRNPERKIQAEKYRETLQDIWSKQYEKNVSLNFDDTENRAPSTSLQCDIVDEFLAPESNYSLDKELEIDDFGQYCQSTPTSLRSGPPVLQWWIENETRFPKLSQWAFDVHSIPDMSAECERFFPSAGQLLTKQRNRLLDDIVEANECLLAWRRADLL